MPRDARRDKGLAQRIRPVIRRCYTRIGEMSRAFSAASTTSILRLVGGIQMARDRFPRSHGPSRADPTRMRNQSALRTSPGTIWLTVGGLFAAICAIPLVGIVATGRAAAAVATLTIVVVVALYAAMVAVRLSASPGPRRLRLMAYCFLGMAGTALLGMVICVLIQWSYPPQA